MREVPRHESGESEKRTRWGKRRVCEKEVGRGEEGFGGHEMRARFPGELEERDGQHSQSLVVL